MEAATVSALAALAGAVIGSASTIIMNLIQQRSETRRKLDETLIHGAMMQWSKYLDLALSGHTKSGGVLYPPFVYILCLSQFAGMIHKVDELSDEEIKVGIAEAYRKIKLISDAANESDLSTQ